MLFDTLLCGTGCGKNAAEPKDIEVCIFVDGATCLRACP